MFGFVSTPPSPSPRRASLEPYSPTSGTTGVDLLANRRRRRPIVDLSPESESSPPDPSSSPLPPVERLDRLLRTISSVLNAYNALPTRSIIYLNTLKEFYKRAVELHPSIVEEPSSPVLSKSGRSRSNLALSSTRAGPKRDPSVEEVEKLEKDWWGSEVVAAWYGPRPGTRIYNERPKGKKERTDRAVTIKRDASFVGLNDE